MNAATVKTNQVLASHKHAMVKLNKAKMAAIKGGSAATGCIIASFLAIPTIKFCNDVLIRGATVIGNAS